MPRIIISRCPEDQRTNITQKDLEEASDNGGQLILTHICPRTSLTTVVGDGSRPGIIGVMRCRRLEVCLREVQSD